MNKDSSFCRFPNKDCLFFFKKKGKNFFFFSIGSANFTSSFVKSFYFKCIDLVWFEAVDTLLLPSSTFKLKRVWYLFATSAICSTLSGVNHNMTRPVIGSDLSSPSKGWSRVLQVMSPLSTWFTNYSLMKTAFSVIMVGWLFWFYGISTFVGYLMSNPLLYK